MIRDKNTIIAILRNGGHVAMGSSSGYWLIDKNNKKRRVSGRTIKLLRNLKIIIRTDDDTSTVGMTWGVPNER